jgi:16S rRNA (guanine(966)-N(2))-methyltransferase RsmD
VRIIGGSAGGRRIRAPRGQATRPTADRVKEAIFNILGPPPEGARVLDLYAGAGALGLEALSRGAAAAVLVDEARAAVECVAANAAALGMTGRARVIRAPVRAALARLTAAGEPPFEWIFLDPPYAGDEAALALAALGGALAKLVAPGATVVVEHDRRHAPADLHGALAREDRRRYGDTEVSFYRRTVEQL